MKTRTYPPPSLSASYKIFYCDKLLSWPSVSITLKAWPTKLSKNCRWILVRLWTPWGKSDLFWSNFSISPKMSKIWCLKANLGARKYQFSRQWCTFKIIISKKETINVKITTSLKVRFKKMKIQKFKPVANV